MERSSQTSYREQKDGSRLARGHELRKKSITKIIIHLVIIISWIGVMVLLVEKEGMIRIQTGEASFRTFIPKDIKLDVWKGIYINDQWIGYVHTILDRDQTSDSSGYVLHSFSFLRFKMFNKLTGMAINSLQYLDSEFRLIAFNARIAGMAKMVIKGKRLGGKIVVSIHHNRNTYTRTFEVGDELFLDQSILSIYRGKGLKVGDSYKFTILNPLTANTDQIEAKVVGKDKDTFVMETKFASLTSRAWIDENGLVIREETPNGWVMKVESEDQIDHHLSQSKRTAVDILKETSVRSHGNITNPRQVRSLTIKVSGIDMNTFSFDKKRQKVMDSEKGIITISAITPVAEKAIEIPYTGKTLKKYLEPSPWIDCEDPAIRATALEIIGDETNSWRAGQKISQWVYENVRKTYSPGIPIATSVLLNRKGDCNEHTTLFIALARAAGIPAEMCTGLVYLKDGFYYHAWPKIFIGSTWVHIDPTFGQTVADATHFELISGGFAAQTQLATTIGKIKIEIINYLFENRKNE
ncbi:MAG: transglutaminase-like domain-containing protein [Deltaproteobacteria bacterium]|nr:transglutaminase-like domain-containing protein [Deltaproteobacteria bacterium]